MHEQENYTAQEFNRLYKELDDLYHEVALKAGISDSELTILYGACRMGDGCMQRDVCEQACISKQTVHSGIRKLEKEGLLFLEQANGRDKHIYLTDAGKEFSRQHVCPLAKIEDDAFAGLTSKERRELLRIVRKYVDNFRELLERS